MSTRSKSVGSVHWATFTYKDYVGVPYSTVQHIGRETRRLRVVYQTQKTDRRHTSSCFTSPFYRLILLSSLATSFQPIQALSKNLSFEGITVSNFLAELHCSNHRITPRHLYLEPATIQVFNRHCKYSILYHRELRRVLQRENYACGRRYEKQRSGSIGRTFHARSERSGPSHTLYPKSACDFFGAEFSNVRFVS